MSKADVAKSLLMRFMCEIFGDFFSVENLYIVILYNYGNLVIFDITAIVPAELSLYILSLP